MVHIFCKLDKKAFNLSVQEKLGENMSKAKKVYELLKENGELMVRVDGEVLEIHLHNTEYSEELDALVVEGGTEKHWIFSDSIQRVWLHRKVED